MGFLWSPRVGRRYAGYLPLPGQSSRSTAPPLQTLERPEKFRSGVSDRYQPSPAARKVAARFGPQPKIRGSESRPLLDLVSILTTTSRAIGATAVSASYFETRLIMKTQSQPIERSQASSVSTTSQDHLSASAASVAEHLELTTSVTARSAPR